MFDEELDWQNTKITDEGIDEIRANIGKRRVIPAWNRIVTREAIEHFALGVGDDNPLWWDDDHAAGTRWGGRVAPPCYLYSHTRGPRLRPEDGRQSVEVYLPGVLGIWAGEKWVWNRLPCENEIIRAESEMVEVLEHEGSFGGRSISHVERQYLLTDKDELVATVDHTIRRFDRSQTRARGAYLDRPLATYTAEDRARFEAQYEAEIGLRRGGTPRYIEDVKVGEKVGPMLKGPLTITNMIGFLLGGGSSLNITNRMLPTFLKMHPGSKMIHPETGIVETIEAPHWETAFARASGMPAGYDFGFQRISWLQHLITDWMGDAGFLKELEVQLRRPNILGDVTWLSGLVTDVDLAAGVATVAITATNQLDETTTRGLARVELPKRP
ncbi:MAG: hypothetical protein JWR84_3073 [Caulobacter sp.]|nr:hypothetical protein [Caulobacter sp.]